MDEKSLCCIYYGKTGFIQHLKDKLVLKTRSSYQPRIVKFALFLK
jgi:hypothetical protein